MALRLVVAATVSTLIASAPLPGVAEQGSAAAVGARTVVDCGNCWPAAFTFTPDGKQIFYVERYTGVIHRYTFKGGGDHQWGSVGPVDGDGERGALGIAVDPRWNKGTRRQRQRNRWVYVFYTNESPLENRIVRLRQRRNGNGVKQEQLLSIGIDTGSNHNAGPMHFGSDGKLYVVTGDQAEPSRAQDLGDPAGKVLRLNRGGGRPNDNPLPGSLAYSFGHRNSFGFAFDPLNDRLWQTENGPECDDETNLVLPGGNYGWGSGSSCPDTSTEGPSPMGPEHEWSPTIVPTGAAFCHNCGLGDSVEGDLLVGVFRSSNNILALSLNGGRDGVTGEDVLYDNSSGVLAMARRKNGQVYFSDSGGIHVLTA